MAVFDVPANPHNATLALILSILGCLGHLPFSRPPGEGGGVPAKPGEGELAPRAAETKPSVGSVPAPVGALTQAQRQAISKIDNIINDHLTTRDISGALRDALGKPVPKPGGGYWNHLQEVKEALRGLRNQAKALEGVADPAAQAARQRALDAIKQVEEATKGLGI
jgi:hypothetical protein